MKRKIDYLLEQWRNSDKRNVLLIRGARQVGKTFSIRQLGSSFKYFIEVNLDFDPQVRKFFESTLDPMILAEKISAYYSMPLIPGETLLFLDEIQACPLAIQSLRYFHERMPSLHVVAAGSLLEFALEQLPSFGVGRISSLYMYPINFQEFVLAMDGPGVANILKNTKPDLLIDPVFHEKFLNLFRTYCIVGGMPAVVQRYKETNDLLACRKIQDELISTFKDDFSKYKTRISQLKLFETFQSVALQSGSKFIYSRISDTAPQVAYKQALDLLEMAGLIHKIYHTAASGIPLGAQINPKQFKVIISDIGIYLRLLNLDLKDILISDVDGLINKGSIAETFVGLELCAGTEPYTKSQLFYWHREAKASNAEVDYVIQKSFDIVPIEVKSGKRGSMQSISLFMSERKTKYGIRLSQENCSRYKNIHILPLYLASSLFLLDL